MSKQRPTIAEALAVRLGRDATNAELCNEVRRILLECASELKGDKKK